MQNILKSLSIACLLASSLSVPTYADSFNDKDVVIDSNKNIVKNSFGNCVRTKWVVDNDKCSEVAEVVAPVTPPAPKTHSRSYLVFFDFDKSELTPDALNIIKAASDDAKTSHSKTFALTGHTDRAGSVPYNIKLSERRNASVEKQLISLGSKDKDIGTKAKGESVPLVPTADGVREAQNRRVEIIFYYVK